MSEHEIDSQLKEYLDLLRQVPERSPDSKHRSRSRFDAELDAYFPVGASYRGSLNAPPARPETPVVRPAPPIVRPVAAAPRSQPWYYRPAFAFLAISLLLVVAMFSGGFITVYAAGSALPGDTLYPLKLDAEQARVSLAFSPARQADLYLEFAQNRLEEMNSLADLGQYEAVGPLALQYSHNVALAAERAQRVLQRDPERALALNKRVIQSMGQFQQTVGLVIVKAPPALQAALKTALDQALQVAPTVEPPAADENKPGGKGNANNNANSNANPNANPNANTNASGGNPSANNGNNSNASENSEKEKKDKEEKDKEEKEKEEKDKDKDKEK
jgi:hypothetical protein